MITPTMGLLWESAIATPLLERRCYVSAGSVSNTRRDSDSSSMLVTPADISNRSAMGQYCRESAMATPIPSNTAEFTLDEIARATSGEAFGAGAALTLRGVGIDTRNLPHGALFVALRGVTDGHKFLPVAAERGAGAAMVERGRHI